jgi:hypothetical protein
MPHIGASGVIVQLPLPQGEQQRLTSFFPEIAARFRPGAPQRVDNGTIRVGNKGSLVLYRDGSWHDFEADEGGNGAFSFAIHEFGGDTVKARRFTSEWLSRAGHGTFDPAGINVEAAQVRAELYAQRAREALEQMLPAEAWSSDAPPVSMLNLRARGLPEPYPTGLLGHLDNARLGECALTGLLTGVDGTTLGVQLGYLAPGGTKSPLIPQRNLFWITLDPEERKSGLFRIPASPGTGDGDVLSNVTLVTEGVEKAIACHTAFPHLPVLGVPGIGRLRRIPAIPGTVLIVRDGDEPGSKADQSLTRGIDHLLLTGSAAVRVTTTSLGLDADKIVLAEGIDALRKLILAAPAVALSADGEAQRLAAIPSALSYEGERTKVAKRLGIRRSALDTAVDAKRRAAEGEDTPSEDVDELGPEPWPEPVTDIAAVLDTASTAIGQHVVTSRLVCDVAALWALHSYFLHHWCIILPISPRFEIGAVSPMCGKSTLLDCVGHLVWRPFDAAASLTVAVLFRLVDTYKPTLVLDEMDDLLRAHDKTELGSLLRASHKRGARVPRNVPIADGKGWALTWFSAWHTYAYTIVGRLKPAMRSRAIRVSLLRARPDELRQLKPMVDGTSPVLVECGRKFRRWAQDQTELPTAEIPEGISHRDADNWRPLLRIAALVGGDWPRRARDAAITLNGRTVAVGDIVPLIIDIFAAFGGRERLTTAELTAAMLALEEPSADWSTAYKKGQINEYWLRDHLGGLVHAPEHERRWKAGTRMVRGYRKEHFKDVFERYLPAEWLNQNEQAGVEAKFFSSIGTPETSGPSVAALRNQGENGDGCRIIHPSPVAPSSVAAPEANKATDAAISATDQKSPSVSASVAEITTINQCYNRLATDGPDNSGVPIEEKNKISIPQAAAQQPDVESVAPGSGDPERQIQPPGDLPSAERPSVIRGANDTKIWLLKSGPATPKE